MKSAKISMKSLGLATNILTWALIVGFTKGIRSSEGHTDHASPSTALHDTLVLLHATTINSRESNSALGTWNSLKPWLSDFVHLRAVNCDESSDECFHLNVAHLPQVLLILGGDVISYEGPLTETALRTFVLHSLPNRVAELDDENMIDWWLKTEVRDKRAVIYFNDMNSQAPILLRAIASKVADTHGVAEVRRATSDMLQRFGVAKLPCLIASSKPDGRGPFIVYAGDMVLPHVLEFLMRHSEQSSSRPAKAPWWELEGIVPETTYGIPHLREDTASSLCNDLCGVVFVPHEPGHRQQRTRRMAFAHSIHEGLKRSERRKKHISSIPRLVWASTAQQKLYRSRPTCKRVALMSFFISSQASHVHEEALSISWH
jgi:hypothetical protein